MAEQQDGEDGEDGEDDEDDEDSGMKLACAYSIIVPLII